MSDNYYQSLDFVYLMSDNYYQSLDFVYLMSDNVNLRLDNHYPRAFFVDFILKIMFL